MMDWISQLPECIVHHILSGFDTPAELVRMSVVSKTWFHLTASFPILDFYINDFRSRESFFKYVEYTTSRFCHQNVTANALRLNATIEELAELDIVNRCLELLFKKGVKLLDIDFSDSDFMPTYRLPNTLLSVSVLKYLTIRGCELPSSLMLDVVKFKSLICLKLQDVQIDDEVIKRLTTSCPLLKGFHINGCNGFKRFCVNGHQNLQQVVIYYETRLERIDIEAPNLSDLWVADVGKTGTPQMNLASCKKLTTVFYSVNPLPNSNCFPNFLSSFPFIENLHLATQRKGNNLKLSSLSLRTLMVSSNCDLEEIEFGTPNLVLFIYSCSPHLPKSMGRIHWPPGPEWDSTNLEACMQCHPDRCVDALWFLKLRLFLDKKNGFKVFNLYIDAIYNQTFTGSEMLKAIELPPYELEHVELQLDTHKKSSDYVDFVDALLWCCRPRSLTLRSSFPLTEFEEQSDVVKFTYEKLLQQEDQDRTRIQIVSPFSSGAQKHLMDLKSLSMALPREGKAISFIKRKKFLKKKRTVKRMQI